MMDVDGNNGDVYVTGQMDADFDQTYIATWRYDSSGNLAAGWPKLWPAQPSGKSFGAVAIVPTNGYVYVVGAYTIDGWGYNTVVLSYSSDGTLLYAKEFDISGECGGNYPVAAVFDGTAQHLWVAMASIGCGSSSFSYDYVLWGLSNDGSTVATARFDYGGYADFPADIKSVGVHNLQGDTTEYIVITGKSYASATHYDIQTVEYALTNGVLMDNTSNLANGGRYAGAGASTDVGISLAITQNVHEGVDVYVCGSTNAGGNNDYITLGYFWDVNAMPQQYSSWVDVRDGTGHGDDVPVKVTIAQDNTNTSSRVIVAGTSLGDASYDAYLISYARNPFDPNEPHPIRFWRSGYAEEDRVADMTAVDASDVYVVEKHFNGSNYDYRTIRLDSSAAVWTTKWTNQGGYIDYDVGLGNDYPAAIRSVFKLDDQNREVSDLYVTGRNSGPFDSGFEYATLRYVQKYPD